jgi:hypothetical protein
MRLERVGAGGVRLTAHAYELVALTAAARMVAERDDPDLPPQARDQLRAVLRSYDRAIGGLEPREP